MRQIGPFEVRDRLDSAPGLVSYEGWDPRLERRVFLEAVSADSDAGGPLDEDARRRWREQANVLSQIGDPRICRLDDYVRDGDRDWLVMEWVEGAPLGAILRGTRRVEGESPLADPMGLVQQVAEVLTEVHGQGLVHGALDADNVVLTADGKVRLHGFGRSWVAGSAEPADDVAALGAVLGDVLRAVRHQGWSEDPEVADLVDELEKVLTTSDPALRPSAGEVVRRLSWIRTAPRRRGRARTIAVVLVAALALGAGYLLELRSSVLEARAAKAAAETARTEAKELSAFMASLFEATDEATNGATGETTGGTLTARGILERGAERLEAEFDDRPLLRARLSLVLGEVYESLGEYQHSHELIEDSLRLRRAAAPADHVAVSESLQAVGWSYRYLGDLDRAIDHFEQALALREEHLAPDDPLVAQTLNGLAIVSRRLGRYQDSEHFHLRALEIRERAFGPDHVEVAKAANNLALLYVYTGRYEESEVLFRRSLAIKETSLEPNHPSLAFTLNNLGNLLADLGRYEEAEVVYQRAADIWHEVGGPDHPNRAANLLNLGLVLLETGRYDEAEPIMREGMRIRHATLGASHPETSYNLSNNIGRLLIETGRLDEAEDAVRDSLIAQLETLGSEHIDLAVSYDRLARIHLARGQVPKAREYAEKARSVAADSLGEDDASALEARYLLALCDLAAGDVARGREALRTVLALYEEAGGAHVQVRQVVTALDGLQRLDDAGRLSAPGFDPAAWVATHLMPGRPNDDQAPEQPT